jgi:hypothetical protein
LGFPDFEVVVCGASVVGVVDAGADVVAGAADLGTLVAGRVLVAPFADVAGDVVDADECCELE